MPLSAEARRRLVVGLADNAIGAEVADGIDGITALASAKIIVGDSNGVAADVSMSGDVTIDNVGATTIGAAKVTEAKMEAGAAAAGVRGSAVRFVANANVIGGVPVLHRIDIADASADTDVVLTHKTRVIDFWFLNTGIAAHATLDTIQLKNGATAITEAVAKTATVNAIKRAATMDPAQVEIAAAGTLRITAAKNTNVAVTAYVLAVRVA